MNNQMSTLCLNMIVKDEEHVIGQTLENLVKHITFSYWVICDTGSTDKTREIITDFFKAKSIPGELLQHEWRDFGHNRTLALQGAYKKADYIFIFDADDTIHGDLKIPAKLTHDFYKLIFGSGFTYYRPLILTAHKKTKFVGVLHEFLALEEGHPSEGTIEGNYYVDSGKTGSRSRDKDKYLKDAMILKAAYKKEVDTGGGLASRYAFYCAQSFKDCGRTDDAIEWYTLVADTLNNWVQEKYYACLMAGFQYKGKGNFVKALEYFLKAEMFDSDRTEGVFFAAEMLKDAGLHSLVVLLYEKYKNYNKNPQDKLFLFQDFYNDFFEFNVGVCAYLCNNKKLSYECCKKVILNNVAQPGVRDRTFKNMRFHVSEMNDDPDTLALFYHLTNYIQTCDEHREMVVLWNMLFKKNRALLTKPSKFKFTKPIQNKVFISFTSCKRLDLFTETVNSILNHWDATQIDYWFCVDDNSSKDDRVAMRKLYPWFNFYMKTQEEKGHRESMNIIWNKLKELKPKYWIHMEDDFLFHVKNNYVEKAVAFLESQTDIKQVLFNRSYAETIDDVDMRGFVPVAPEFVVHEYKQGQFPYKNCHYWPHYSFRPSMIDVETILKLGNYDSPNTFFERDYANKWVDAGFKSAFFDMVCCRHTGRLTTEIKDSKVKNAYDLNNEKQFNKRKAMKVINLKRRPDRRETMTKMFANIKFTDYEFIDAVDGKQIKPTFELKKLFEGNDFGSRAGVIGCALTHYNLWTSLLNSDDDYYVIFEDDVTLSPSFSKVYHALEKKELFKKCDYLFLGYHMFSANREATKDVYVKESDSIAIGDMQNDLNIGAGFAYSINKKGARILIDYIKKNGIKHGIDYVVKICKELKCMELRPQIVFSEWYERTDQNVDTDIQKDFTSLDFDNIVEDFTFVQGLDHMGDDLFFNKVDVEEAKRLALENPNCMGFNTLGFFKSNVNANTLQRSQYFGANDGIYIKNVNKPVSTRPKLKLIGNWQSSQKMADEFGVMSHDAFELTWKDEADYYAIVNLPNADEYYDSKKSMIFQMEPWVYDDTKPWGVKTWGAWANPDPSKFLHVNCHRRFLNPAQWSLNGDLANLPPKKDEAAIVLSNKTNDTGHKLRIGFVRDMETIDVYGKENYHNLTSYISPVPDDNRYNVYSKYKYVLAVENNSEINYASEKIWEPLMCECLPFYWGCPNLETYIDPQAFVRLPLDDVAESMRIVEQAIREDWWSQRIDAIRAAKQKIITELGFFPRIQKIIEKRTLYIAGCVKNCGKYLNTVFQNIRKIVTLFDSYQVLIAYDDSDDNSLFELNRLSKEFDIQIIRANGRSSIRCENICDARNLILKYLKGREYKYLMMMDMDDVCSAPINIPVLKETLERNDWDSVSFNCNPYYDIWALSIDKYRFSCWHFVEEHNGMKVREMEKYIADKLNNTKKSDLIECESAFNGFAIYRPEKFVDCEYSAKISDSIQYMRPEDMVGTYTTKKEECEHRPFHLKAVHKNGARIRISPLYLFDTNAEAQCQLVSSRGILGSCKVKSSNPISSIQTLISYNWSDLKDGTTLYVCSNAIKHFVTCLDSIPVKFVLVSGDCDELVPNDCFENNANFLKFIESDKIIHWYAQNCVGTHPKLSGIPIGLDYHTVKTQDHPWSPMMSPLTQESQIVSLNKIPFTERTIKCYSNFHFTIHGRKFGSDRVDAMNNVPKELVFYEPTTLPRIESWMNQAKYAFVLSPQGGGLDCHRTWEALCLGCIPIVKTSQINYLFDDLPVLIVNEWKDVTKNLLEQTVADFSTKKFDYSKITLKYWMDKIRS